MAFFYAMLLFFYAMVYLGCRQAAMDCHHGDTYSIRQRWHTDNVLYTTEDRLRLLRPPMGYGARIANARHKQVLRVEQRRERLGYDHVR